ncbi:MAG: cobalamin biosynthesis central domain-containing protein, partial [Nitrospinota bacterium]
MKRVSLFCLTRGGLALARLLGEGLGGGELHLPERLAPEASFPFGEVHPFRTLGEACREAFTRSSGLIFIMAAGIVVRSLAPLLKDKRREPGVVVVDEGGAYAISLLGGHRGGGNALAGRVASLTGGRAVVTTGSEVRGTLALDLLAERFGLTPEDSLALRRASMALVEGEKVAFWAEDEIAPYLKKEIE